jgi:hypothetical protein
MSARYLSLLDGEVARGKASKDTYIEVVLTYAIINAFPCLIVTA